ncbi:MAG: TrkH family potassium uptake protein [Hyphomicrobiales bacterium]|nr:TrkH family potassium uptake protein [Hyphomicrobiales bacterium]
MPYVQVFTVTDLKQSTLSSSDIGVDLNPVFHVVGWNVAVLGLLMVVPAATDFVDQHNDWQVFAASSVTTTFFGALLILATKSNGFRLGIHQAFILTVFVWLASAIVGAVPLAFSQLDLTYADSFFEAMSGITTTGSTILVGLDFLPPGILLWRSILQGVGGIGFIATGIALLPILKVGGMQLFRLESSERSEKIVPQAKRFVAFIVGIYVVLILACTLFYDLAGMTIFEAVCHALATVSTGGYSTSDASLGHFDNPAIDLACVVFMLAGSIPFILYIRALQGRPERLLRDAQVRGYLKFLALVVLGLTVWLCLERDEQIFPALRHAMLNVVSIATTTGFASGDYSLWGEPVIAVFFFLTFVGGCSGSTAGGLKAFRFDMLALAFSIYVRRLVYPHGTFVANYNGRRIGDDVFAGVLMFMGVYLLTVAVISVVLALCGLDFITSISGAATAVSNVGPGLGASIGPAGNFASLPEAAKWILSFAMLLGRLEFFTVLALLTPGFWRR